MFCDFSKNIKFSFEVVLFSMSYYSDEEYGGGSESEAEPEYISDFSDADFEVEDEFAQEPDGNWEIECEVCKNRFTGPSAVFSKKLCTLCLKKDELITLAVLGAASEQTPTAAVVPPANTRATMEGMVKFFMTEENTVSIHAGGYDQVFVRIKFPGDPVSTPIKLYQDVEFIANFPPLVNYVFLSAHLNKRSHSLCYSRAMVEHTSTTKRYAVLAILRSKETAPKFHIVLYNGNHAHLKFDTVAISVFKKEYVYVPDAPLGDVSTMLDLLKIHFAESGMVWKEADGPNKDEAGRTVGEVVPPKATRGKNSKSTTLKILPKKVKVPKKPRNHKAANSRKVRHTAHIVVAL